jgi:hypothetical protein
LTQGRLGWLPKGANITVELEIQRTIRKALTAAFLIAADMNCAEAAMLHKIISIKRQDFIVEALLYHSLCLALQRCLGSPDLNAATSACDLTALPKELQTVSRLPPLRRGCFVLHFLLELPQQTAAGLLQMDVR